MGFLSRITASFGETAQAGDASSFLTRAFGGTRSSSGIHVSESTALNNSAVYACTRILAETIAHPPLVVLERKGKDKIEKADDLEIYWALKGEFNDHMSSFIARETVMAHVAGWGNGYFEIERTKNGEPRKLWPMLPDRTGPVMQNGRVHYETRIDGNIVRVSAANTLHIPGLGFDGYRGYSPIQIQRNAMGLAAATEEFGAKYFRQGSKTGGVLMHPTVLGEKAKGNIRKDFEDENAGLENAHRLTILEEGMKFIPTTIPPNDAQFLETRKFQVVEIARFYRMQLHKLQEMGDATYSNIEQQAMEFVVDTMLPWFVRWEQELDRKLWTTPELKRRYFCKFNLNSLLRGDSASRAAFYNVMITSGIMTRNEARLLEELNPIDGLDEPLIPLNMVTIEQQQQQLEMQKNAANQPAQQKNRQPNNQQQKNLPKDPNERALAILEAQRMVIKGIPGADKALLRLIKSGNMGIYG